MSRARDKEGNNERESHLEIETLGWPYGLADPGNRIRLSRAGRRVSRSAGMAMAAAPWPASPRLMTSVFCAP